MTIDRYFLRQVIIYQTLNLL